jgi:hypothetical protein
MKEFSNTTRSQAIPLFTLIVIIASLCFSMGEGLRLTPFPFTSVVPVKQTRVQLDAEASPDSPLYNASIYKYGPLSVPTQIQKRSKRQGVDFACVTSAGSREVSTYVSFSFDDEPFHGVSVAFVSRPAGRAPPYIS